MGPNRHAKELLKAGKPGSRSSGIRFMACSSSAQQSLGDGLSRDNESSKLKKSQDLQLRKPERAYAETVN
ncbi:hypothetical protein MUK42_33883, partial [Musa troglodytarum]